MVILALRFVLVHSWRGILLAMPRKKSASSKVPKASKKRSETASFGYNLNEEQKQAVTHGPGPLLIVAGAGTGKTTVITERVVWLIREQKARPEEMLVLTFTEKAASEMEERIDRLLPYGYVDIAVSTFHAFGEHILREYGLEIGLDPKFRVLSTADQWLMLRERFHELELKHYKPLGNPTRFLHALLTNFSRAKDEIVSAEAYQQYAQSLQKERYADDEEKEIAEKTLEVARAYAWYETLLRESGHLDFGDLIAQTLRLVQERPAIASILRKRYRHILVDEFQDTNFAQYELVKLLAAPENNLTVVGDDDQSIYKFRGASLSNILEFKKDFPECAEVSLIQNYRSRQNILDLAHTFIQQNNPNRLEAQLNGKVLADKGKPLANPVSKKLVSSTKGKGVIRLFHEVTSEEEARRVVDDIVKNKKSNPKLSFNDIAVLVRANSHAEPFVRALESSDIPYQFVAARGLLQQPEVLDVTSYLKLLDNYHESASFYRVLAMPHIGLQHRTIMDLLQYSRRKNIPLFVASEVAGSIREIPADDLRSIQHLLGMVQEHTKLAAKKSVGFVLYQFLTDHHYIDRFDRDRDAAKIQNIAKFYKMVRDFEERNTDKSVKAFVQEIELLLEVGEDASPTAVIEGPESVKVLTVHGAKGLEFSHVYIVQCADKRFPTVERRDAIPLPDALIKEIVPVGDAHLEEERRLFYVAMTRAKSSLTFTTAEDYGGARKKKPSRFLFELDLLKDVPKPEHISNAPLPRQLSFRKTEPKAAYALPAKFSFTQLKAFETCPKQYWYAHILAIPVVGRYTFSFGKTMHATLQKFFAEIQKGTVPGFEELLKLYDESWIDEWYDTKVQERERKQSGRAALEKFYEKEKDHFAIAPLALEQGFNVRIGSYTVKGAIDRIDPIGDKHSKKVEIIDYKTGKVPKDVRDGLDQLVLYAIASVDVLGYEPETLTYYYLEEGKKVSHNVKPEAIDKTKEYVLGLIEKMTKSTFKATPGFHCQFCDFKEICEDRQL